MIVEWSDEALADLHRFAAFLQRQHPPLATLVASKIIEKVELLSEYPLLGRAIKGREQYRQIILQIFNTAYVFHTDMTGNDWSYWSFSWPGETRVTRVPRHHM